jgi:predicted small metal-binding protein
MYSYPDKAPMSSFACKDVGMNCGFAIHGAQSKDEVMQLATVHAKIVHGIHPIPNDLASKVQAAIKP